MLIFFPGNDKAHPIEYQGAREVDAMVEWVKNHATTKFALDGEEAGGASPDEL
jgi:hypothetical protein